MCSGSEAGSYLRLIDGVYNNEEENLRDEVEELALPR